MEKENAQVGAIPKAAGMESLSARLARNPTCAPSSTARNPRVSPPQPAPLQEGVELVQAAQAPTLREDAAAASLTEAPWGAALSRRSEVHSSRRDTAPDSPPAPEDRATGGTSRFFPMGLGTAASRELASVSTSALSGGSGGGRGGGGGGSGDGSMPEAECMPAEGAAGGAARWVDLERLARLEWEGRPCETQLDLVVDGEASGRQSSSGELAVRVGRQPGGASVPVPPRLGLRMSSLIPTTADFLDRFKVVKR